VSHKPRLSRKDQPADLGTVLDAAGAVVAARGSKVQGLSRKLKARFQAKYDCAVLSHSILEIKRQRTFIDIAGVVNDDVIGRKQLNIEL
jgi:hypothetical protein